MSSTRVAAAVTTTALMGAVVVGASATTAAAATTATTTSAACQAISLPSGNTNCDTTTPVMGSSIPESGSHRPAPGTGGLILRTEDGTDIGSGIGEGQTYNIVGKCANGMDEVHQVVRGSGGGWGDAEDGCVRGQFGIPA